MLRFSRCNAILKVVEKCSNHLRRYLDLLIFSFLPLGWCVGVYFVF